MKKGIVAGVSLAVLLGVGVFGINSVFADTSNSTKVVQAPQHKAGKRVQFLNQHKDQIHQINQLKEETLDLKKQMVEKRDQLLDLFLAAKTSRNKDQLKQAKAMKPQIKTLNKDIKSLLKSAKDEKTALKQAVKNNSGDGTEQINQLITTHQQINAKMKDKVAQLDKLISVFSSKTSM